MYTVSIYSIYCIYHKGSGVKFDEKKTKKPWSQPMFSWVKGLIEKDLKNIKEVSEAGANIFVSGSTIFNSSDYSSTIKEMKSLVS